MAFVVFIAIPQGVHAPGRPRARRAAVRGIAGRRGEPVRHEIGDKRVHDLARTSMTTSSHGHVPVRPHACSVLDP
jgi:hypothetical protein